MSGNVTEVLAGFAGVAAIRRSSGTCPRSLQECSARHAGMRGRRAPRRRDATGRGAGVGAGAIQREQRHRRRPAVARRRDHAQRLSHHRRHHVRHPPLDADPRHAGGDAARAWRSPSATACRAATCWSRIAAGMRGDDADRHRHRLSGVPRQGLARPGRARAVRRRRGGRPPARVRHRDHGQGVRPRRQPGGRHLRRVGHADGEIPPVPRRAVGADGGAAGRAEIPGDARIPDRQGRRPLQHLCQRRQPRSRHRRSRPALGARTDRAAPVAVGLVDPGHEHRACSISSNSTRSIPPR